MGLMIYIIYIIGIIITVIERSFFRKPNFLSFCCFLNFFLPSFPTIACSDLLERGKERSMPMGYLTIVGDWSELITFNASLSEVIRTYSMENLPREFVPIFKVSYRRSKISISSSR